MTLTEISTTLKLPYSTTFRILETLVQRGFVHQSQPYGAYVVGVKAFEVGAGYMRTSLSAAARPEMEDLAKELNETCNLAIRDGSEAVYVDQVEGSRRVRMFTRVGARAPLHCTGVGKALLAGERREVVESILGSQPLPRYTSNSVSTLRALLKELGATRSRGYALDLEEYEMGVRCAAAPIRDAGGKVIASISVSAPVQRFPDEKLEAVGRYVTDCATSISMRLGWMQQ
jgi:IclR family acetate operon transcriptional repressor